MTRAFTSQRRRLTALRRAALGMASPAETPVEVVRHLLAMQAQDFAGAKWAVALRTRSATEKAVDAALASGEIVRSWPMRGTLHFTAPEDLGWMLGLTRDRMLQLSAGRHRQLGLDAAAFASAATVAEHKLSSSRSIDRSDLLAAFDAAGISTEGQRGIHLIWYLAVTGLIVFGPPNGKQQTFALLEKWVHKPRSIVGDEALAEFARRYFFGHGPATERDFAWWSSLTLTQARRGIAAVRDEFDEIEVDGQSYLLRKDLQPATGGVHALPGFDEYLLGYQDRSAQLAPEWSKRVVPGGNGLFLPTVVVNGEIVGTWKRAATRSELTVTVDAFAPLSAATSKAFNAAIKRYGRYLGTTAVVA